ncbi:MAG: hypothetical protein KAY24_17620 [Candidatus Eisenbacteria sp.]|nr:hypothetical protein [Candidatus Eisenbacteria bacterium]
MRWHYLVIALSIGLLASGSDGCSAEQAREPEAEKEVTTEYMLATLNAGRWIAAADITIARFRSLLDQLSAKFVEDRQQIADMAVMARKLLREDNGIDESLLNIMEGLNTVFYSDLKNQTFAEYSAAYGALRSSGQTHDEVIERLKAAAATIRLH